MNRYQWSKVVAVMDFIVYPVILFMLFFAFAMNDTGSVVPNYMNLVAVAGLVLPPVLGGLLFGLNKVRSDSLKLKPPKNSKGVDAVIVSLMLVSILLVIVPVLVFWGKILLPL